MNRCAKLSALALFFAFVVAVPLPVVAQQITGGMMRRPSAQSVGPNSFSVGSYDLNFPTTPVGGTNLQACYFNCFFVNSPDNCNGIGTIALSKTTAAPFFVGNFRKAVFATLDANCDGTPVTFPVSLQSGEALIQDFSFSPTIAGSFNDTYVYDMNGGAFVWNLSGSTPNAAPTIVSFAATPTTIRPGQPVTLSWIVQGASSVLIDNGVGAVGATGTVTVTPSSTTSYTLTAMGASGSSTATATVNVINAPAIVVSALPSAMVQAQGLAGGSTSYALTNAGGSASSITLSQNGSFFSQSPSSFTLNPGATQVVTIIGSAEGADVFEGASIPSGGGVSSGLAIPIKLLSTAPPAGTVTATPASNRVDVAAAPNGSPTGTVTFRNSGNSMLTGVLVSSVPWLIPQRGIVTIPPGSSASFSFTIDRSQRPDANALTGSASGDLSLVYLSGAAGKIGTLDTTPTPSVTTVAVVDTVQLAVSTGGPPPLNPGEVALFVPGVGHVVGSVGTFLSDLSLLNPPGSPSINDVRFFYTPRTGVTSDQKSAALPSLGSVSVALADVVKNVFGNDGQVGSLQIRSASAAKLSVNANVFNASNPAGTYGTAIPTFRSDRGIGPGGELVITGLRHDAASHTNLFIQETAGVGASVQTEFLAADGTSLGIRTDQAGPFALVENDRVVPTGAVAAILTNTGSNGAFLAYATPVDELSGDNWSLVDWSRQYGYSGGDPVIVPVAGTLQGANNAFFRTDIAITNISASQGTGTLRFYPRGGAPVDRQIPPLGARQSNIVNDVIGTLFNAPSGSVGYLLFTPASGTFVITSRTYSTVTGRPGTFGTGVPTLPAAGSLGAGALRAIGSLQDAALATVNAQRPATFRTNFGMLETTGNSVNVRVTLRFSYPAGAKVQGIGSASKDYQLGPNQFMQVPLASDVLGASRGTLGDLKDLEVDFQVLSGNGAIAVYTSSTDNGTADSILRTE